MTAPTPNLGNRVALRRQRQAAPLALAAFVLALAAARPAAALLYIVTNADDSGAGSFRQAILDANANGDPANSITFSITGTGPHVIALQSALPQITKTTGISGFIEQLAAGVPGVVLDGSAIAAGGTDGLSFSSAATGSSVTYLSIVDFTGDGIDIQSANTTVTNCYVGVLTNGTTADGSSGDGIEVSAAGVTIGGDSTTRNVISGNSGYGIRLNSSATSAVVEGNYVGLDATGAAALANAAGGIFVGADGARIGNTTATDRNVVTGNTGIGITISADQVLVYGNYVGLNAAGDAKVGSQSSGIQVASGSADCTIGGTTAGHRNVISGHSNFGLQIVGSTSGCTIKGNYFGLNAAGTAAVGNGTGVSLAGSNHQLGGATAADRNIVSGNTSYGVTLSAPTNKVLGNYIGTNTSGTAAIANGSGVRLANSTGGVVGGTNAGEGNLISGNTTSGITCDGSAEGFSILGNLIGTNAAASAAVPNGTGVNLRGSGNTLGGTIAAARNVISGNTNDGVTADGTGHTITGNHIGVDGPGTAALGNGTGIRLYNSGHQVGGSTAGARNVISGNSSNGLFVNGSSHVIAGNYVGTNAAGTAALGNGGYALRADTIDHVVIGGDTAAHGNVFAGNVRGVNLGYGSHDNQLFNNVIGLNAAATSDLADTGTGIEIGDSFDNWIGAPGKGNVIAGMTYHGIGISGEGSTGNVIQGNWIGTNKVAATTLGNDFAGIFVTESSGNKIGGTGAGEGNVIAHNYQFGVWVERGEANEISGNSIYGNYFGIDVDQQGFFPNDGGDGDDGGNRAQNYPLISSAVVNGGATDVEGLLINEPNTEYRVEFFSSPDCGTAGFGQGKTFRGSTLVTTNGGGQAPLATSIPQAIADAFLTATVTDPLGNTSEFSPCAQVNLGESPGKFQFDRDVFMGYEGILPTSKVIVTRSHGLSGTATVSFTTSNGAAIAGNDYADSDQTLTFEPWEVVKHVEVPILLELAAEPDHEDVLLALTAPTGGATLGSPATAEIQIIDFTDDWPGLTVGDAHVVEGDGEEVFLTFDVNLTATDHQVKVTYLAEPGSALEGVDYEYVEGVLTFPPSASTQTQQVQISILGETDVEPDEIVWLRITTAPSGGNWIAYDVYGRGEIRNDDDNGVDPPPSNVIFADSFEIGSTTLWSSTVPQP
jgi:hypothetical protein